MCSLKLKKLEENKFKVESINSKVNTDYLWESWVSLRAKILFDGFQEMNIIDSDDLGLQARWEYLKGREINNKAIDASLEKRKLIENDIIQLFDKFDFLAQPSAQIFPFDKNLNNPEKIDQFDLDSYHRYMEVVVLSSILGLPTISIPIGFNKNGLAMGMQIIAKKKQDLKLIAFAKKYEEIFNFSKIKPKLFQ